MVGAKEAVIFPGQGSQKLGMFADISRKYPEFQKTLADASKIIGYDVEELISIGPIEKLNRSYYTQPILLVVEVALFSLAQKLNLLTPAFLGGHSLGEYSALVCGGAISFPEAIMLVMKRAELMEKASQNIYGGMLAIVGLKIDVVEKICDVCRNNDVLDIANYNSVEQIVVSGEMSAIERVIEELKNYHPRLVKKIAISVPAHCSIMKSSASEFRDYLEKVNIKKCFIPVVKSMNGTLYGDENDIRKSLGEQLYSRVNWVKTISFLDENKVNSYIECGPSRVLAGLNKRILPGREVISLEQILLER